MQALAACAAAARTRARPRTGGSLTAADVHPSDYPTVTAVVGSTPSCSANSAARSSCGSITRELGSEKDTLELARIGALAMTRVHSSVLNNAVPATRILSLPYVFDSTEHMRRAFDGVFGAEILAACESAV